MKTRLLALALLCGALAILVPGSVVGERFGLPSMTSIDGGRSEPRPGAWDDGGWVGSPAPFGFTRRFAEDPRLDPEAVAAGTALDRMAWQLDAPAFPGDSPGSLCARYESSLDAGWFGFRLPRPLAASETFTAAAVFVIASEGLSADPNGFFQISWGLWNESRTGLNRTGNFESFAADTFEMIEFAWFPNVSPFFGGPFLAPAVFGADVAGDAFANFTSLFGLQVPLPLDLPLLAVLEHRPEADALVTTVYRILDSGRVVPVDGAVGVAPLAGLAWREYEVDTLGLTLWSDGFAGPVPAVTATLDFHVLAATTQLVARPEAMLALDAGGDDEDGDEDEDGDDD